MQQRPSPEGRLCVKAAGEVGSPSVLRPALGILEKEALPGAKHRGIQVRCSHPLTPPHASLGPGLSPHVHQPGWPGLQRAAVASGQSWSALCSGLSPIPALHVL